MADLNTYESGWRKVCDDLDAHPDVEVLWEFDGGLDPHATDAAAAWRSIAPAEVTSAPAGLELRHLRFEALGRQWGSEEPHVNGEFHLTHLARAVSPAHETWISPWDGGARFRTSELRIIDEHPITGPGHFAALRLASGGGEPEIWWSTLNYGDWRMDIGYSEYLDTLRATKGAFDWQFLFTYAPLESEEFESVRYRVEDMLEARPVLFPEHDYAPLERRLAARL